MRDPEAEKILKVCTHSTTTPLLHYHDTCGSFLGTALALVRVTVCTALMPWIKCLVKLAAYLPCFLSILLSASFPFCEGLQINLKYGVVLFIAIFVSSSTL